MTLDEATIIQTIYNDHDPNFTVSDRQKAHELALACMRAFLFARSGGSWDPHALLPGETTKPSIYAHERIPSF